MADLTFTNCNKIQSSNGWSGFSHALWWASEEHAGTKTGMFVCQVNSSHHICSLLSLPIISSPPSTLAHQLKPLEMWTIAWPLYINSLSTACRSSGLVQILARFRPLVRSKIAGLKGQINTVGGHDTILVWRGLVHFRSEDKYPIVAHCNHILTDIQHHPVSASTQLSHSCFWLPSGFPAFPASHHIRLNYHLFHLWKSKTPSYPCVKKCRTPCRSRDSHL